MGPDAEVWMLRTGEIDARQIDAQALDERELDRLERLQRPVDSNAFLVTHLLLRQLLGRQLGCDPKEPRFVREPCPYCGAPKGRPILETPSRSLHFSISRSEGIVLVALASRPVGIDVQRLPAPGVAGEVGALLHHSERQAIQSAQSELQPAVFARLWTRKEAYLKGIGTGVAHGLEGVDVTGGPASQTLGWSIADIAVPEDYRAAIALKL